MNAKKEEKAEFLFKLVFVMGIIEVAIFFSLFGFFLGFGIVFVLKKYYDLAGFCVSSGVMNIVLAECLMSHMKDAKKLMECVKKKNKR